MKATLDTRGFLENEPLNLDEVANGGVLLSDEDSHAAVSAALAVRRLIDTDSKTRKTFPMAAGLLDYFPDALAAVAQVSWIGNEQHNPGQPLHWSRGKSMDHADCIMRHLVGRGGFDGKVRHTAALAWRALALLQEELEQEFHLSLPRNAWVDEVSSMSTKLRRDDE